MSCSLSDSDSDSCTCFTQRTCAQPATLLTEDGFINGSITVTNSQDRIYLGRRTAYKVDRRCMRRLPTKQIRDHNRSFFRYCGAAGETLRNPNTRCFYLSDPSSILICLACSRTYRHQHRQSPDKIAPIYHLLGANSPLWSRFQRFAQALGGADEPGSP